MIQEKNTEKEEQASKMIAYLKFILEFCTPWVIPDICLKSNNWSVLSYKILIFKNFWGNNTKTRM